MAEMIDHALDYAGRGWQVFPLAEKSKIPQKGSRGFLDASVNERIINRQWDVSQNANIGIATGEKTGFFVVDIDGEAGSRSLTALENEIGPLPETMEQRTGSGGRHLVFKWPESREIRNKQGVREGIDIRGNGGYIVAAPSVHPSGGLYEWVETCNPAEIPTSWLEMLSPKAKRAAPWQSVTKEAPELVEVVAPAGGRMSVMERARLYLAQCEPAVQGQAGHDKLMWAAKSLTIGFELDDITATDLLWSHYNPRCSPQWDRGNVADNKDFERKVTESRKAHSQKPRGWLLDELGLRSSSDLLADIGRGRESARNLLTGLGQEFKVDEETIKHSSFPVEYFPDRIGRFCKQVANAHVVDISFTALPMIIATSAAMGNAWRLRLKRGFEVPPTLWGGIVANSGSNKSGPLGEVMAPLRKNIPPAEMMTGSMLNPQADIVVANATLEAIISRLNESPRGLIAFRDELAGWVNSFDAYKKSSGDEQAWLEFWDAKEYKMDRKTNDERVKIPSASVCVLGGIQPQKLVECFDPGKFASGLVPRLLITSPPEKSMMWTENEVDEHASEEWERVIMALRTQEFASFDPTQSQYKPNVLTLSPEAKKIYVEFFNKISKKMHKTTDEHAKSFMSKARVNAARLMLVHRGLLVGSSPAEMIENPVGEDSAKAGCAWGEWFLNEQLRVYGYSAAEYEHVQADKLLSLVREKGRGDVVTTRLLMRTNARRFPDAKAATAAIESLVAAGYAVWEDTKKDKAKIIEGK